MKIEDLTFNSIDDVRHLTVSTEIVRAVWYAVRVCQPEATAHRFVTALAMTDNLNNQERWPEVLQAVADLEEAAGLRG